MANVLDRLRAALAECYTIERELGSGGMATVSVAEVALCVTVNWPLVAGSLAAATLAAMLT